MDNLHQRMNGENYENLRQYAKVLEAKQQNKTWNKAQPRYEKTLMHKASSPRVIVDGDDYEINLFYFTLLLNLFLLIF